MCGADQTTGRSYAATHLAASDPTSWPFWARCNGSGSCTSFETLLLPEHSSVCCIDTLNPQPKGDFHDRPFSGSGTVFFVRLAICFLSGFPPPLAVLASACHSFGNVTLNSIFANCSG